MKENFHIFRRFMKLKYQLKEPARGVQVRRIDIAAKALVTNNPICTTNTKAYKTTLLSLMP